jgi:hypothetical protein
MNARLLPAFVAVHISLQRGKASNNSFDVCPRRMSTNSRTYALPRPIFSPGAFTVSNWKYWFVGRPPPLPTLRVSGRWGGNRGPNGVFVWLLGNKEGREELGKEGGRTNAPPPPNQRNRAGAKQSALHMGLCRARALPSDHFVPWAMHACSYWT